MQVRRSLSSKIPDAADRWRSGAGRHQLRSRRRPAGLAVIFTDHLAFVVSPQHRFAKLETVSITELGMETFIAHNVLSPYREVVLREFQRHHVPLNMDVEMPTVETIRKLVQRNEGVAFLPRMCVEQEIEQKLLREIKVPELSVERKIRLVYPGQARPEPRRQGVSGSGEELAVPRMFFHQTLSWAYDRKGRSALAFEFNRRYFFIGSLLGRRGSGGRIRHRRLAEEPGLQIAEREAEYRLDRRGRQGVQRYRRLRLREHRCALRCR